MSRRPRPVAWLGLAVAAALATGGCSGTGDPPATGVATAPPATTASPAATTTPATDASGPTTAAPAQVGYRYPVAGCLATYGQHASYPAADMFTRRGCVFVAPVAGRSI